MRTKLPTTLLIAGLALLGSVCTAPTAAAAEEIAVHKPIQVKEVYIEDPVSSAYEPVSGQVDISDLIAGIDLEKIGREEDSEQVCFSGYYGQFVVRQNEQYYLLSLYRVPEFFGLEKITKIDKQGGRYLIETQDEERCYSHPALFKAIKTRILKKKPGTSNSAVF